MEKYVLYKQTNNYLIKTTTLIKAKILSPRKLFGLHYFLPVPRVHPFEFIIIVRKC